MSWEQRNGMLSDWRVWCGHEPHCSGCTKAGWWREDLDCFNQWLDEMGAPREEAGQPLSLVGRVMRLPEDYRARDAANRARRSGPPTLDAGGGGE